MTHRQYSTDRKKRTVAMAAALIIALAAGLLIGTVRCKAAEEQLATAWILCKPGEGNRVNVRMQPDKRSRDIGYLEAGDSFLTDGQTKDGYVRCYGIGECAGWVYSGYVVIEKPEPVFENYVCVAPVRAACRRWIGGPQVERSPWIYNMENVSVFYVAEGWACTSRGFVQAEWLEVNPE